MMVYHREDRECAMVMVLCSGVFGCGVVLSDFFPFLRLKKYNGDIEQAEADEI